MFRKSEGFTLLEAMVAIVVLSASLMATYSWVNVSIQMLIRADEVMTQEMLLDELLEELQLMNLDEIRSGTVSSDNLVADWNVASQLVQSGRNTRGILGFYDHTLYDVEIVLTKNEVPVAEYSVRTTSYRRVRNPQFEE